MRKGACRAVTQQAFHYHIYHHNSVIGDNTPTGVSTSGRAMATYGIYIDGDSHGHITRNLWQGVKGTVKSADATGIRVGTLHGIANNQLTKHGTTNAADFAKGDAIGIHAMEGVAETGVIRMNDEGVQADENNASGVRVGYFYNKVDGSEAVDEEEIVKEIKNNEFLRWH